MSKFLQGLFMYIIIVQLYCQDEALISWIVLYSQEPSKHKDIEEISLHKAEYQNFSQITEDEKHGDVILDLEEG